VQPSNKQFWPSDISGAVGGANKVSEESDSLKVSARVSRILRTQHPLEKRLQAVLACLARMTGAALRNKACILFYRQAVASLDPFLTHPACNWQNKPTAQHFAYLYSLSMTPPSADEILLSDISPFLADRADAHQFGHYAIPIRYNNSLFGVLFLLTESSPCRSRSRLVMLRLIGEMLGFAVACDQLQQELVKLRKVTGEAAEAKFHFWANVNHEIRTPMNGVLGMLDLLSDTELAPTQREHLKTAYRSAKRLLKVIDDLLIFARPDISKRRKGCVNIPIVKAYPASPPC
jgi:signal transduction histidine kinase